MIPKNFKDAERAKGISPSFEMAGSLPDWYIAKRDVPFPELSEGDLCISVRQKIFLEFVMPYVINTLIKNPLAGELYDGELVSALLKIPDLKNMVNKSEKSLIISALEKVLDDIGEEEKKEIADLIRVLS